MPTCLALLAACASHRIPAELRGYTILVERGDEERNELARALQESGFKVRRAVRGGSGPTAALVYFSVRAAEPGGPPALHLRLADTRSGVILRAASILLDSTTQSPRRRAQAAVQAIVAQDSTFLAP